MGSRGDQGGAEAVVSLLWEPSQGFILASIQKPATTDNIFITDRSGHTQFSQSKHYLCNTHSDEELRQGKQGPSEHPGPLGPRHSPRVAICLWSHWLHFQESSSHHTGDRVLPEACSGSNRHFKAGGGKCV